MQASPLARGLFHRAIGQSGGAFQSMSHRSEDRTYAVSGESLGLKFGAALVGAQGDQSLAALRELPAERILEVAQSSPDFNVYEFLPTVDGEAYMELGPTIRAGDHLRIPQMALVARAWAERRAANAGGRD